MAKKGVFQAAHVIGWDEQWQLANSFKLATRGGGQADRLAADAVGIFDGAEAHSGCCRCR